MVKYAMRNKESNTLLDPFDLLKFIIDKIVNYLPQGDDGAALFNRVGIFQKFGKIVYKCINI